MSVYFLLKVLKHTQNYREGNEANKSSYEVCFSWSQLDRQLILVPTFLFCAMAMADDIQCLPISL